MEERFHTTSPLKKHTRFAAQNSCILLGRVTRVPTKVVKRIVKFEILNFWHFFVLLLFFGRLTW